MNSTRIANSGYVLNGEVAGKAWEIEQLDKAHYVLKISGEFYTSADNQRALLDEVTALDGRGR